jgi:hypothetical protein
VKPRPRVLATGVAARTTASRKDRRSRTARWMWLERFWQPPPISRTKRRPKCVAGSVIACDKREAFAQGSVSDEAIQSSRKSHLDRFAIARNDEVISPSLPATNAKRLRKGASATKRSSLFLTLDRFAGAREDDSPLLPSHIPVRRPHICRQGSKCRLQIRPGFPICSAGPFPYSLGPHSASPALPASGPLPPRLQI